LSVIKNDNYLISVIVVTYNSFSFVIETLESIMNQSYQNIELIITDDCSRDNTLEICENWIEGNKSRFIKSKIIRANRNTGVSANLNRGIAASQGLYIKAIAGDDILLKNCILDNIQFAIHNNASFIFSDMIYFKINEFDQHEDIEDHVNNKLQAYFNKFSDLNSEGQRIFYSRDPIFINSPTWFCAKNKIPEYDEDFIRVEDQSFIFRYLDGGEKISYMDKITVYYRRYNQAEDLNKYFLFFNDFILCFSKYRMKTLSLTSFVDIMFIVNFRIEFNLKRWSRKNILFKIIAYPIKRLNPVKLFNISPLKGLSGFMSKELN